MITVPQILSAEFDALARGRDSALYSPSSVAASPTWREAAELVAALGRRSSVGAVAVFDRISALGRLRRVSRDAWSPAADVVATITAAAAGLERIAEAELLKAAGASDWLLAAEAVQQAFDAGAVFDDEERVAHAAALVVAEFERVLCGLSETALRSRSGALKRISETMATEFRARFDAVMADGPGAFGMLDELAREQLDVFDPSAVVGLDAWHDTRADWKSLRAAAVVTPDDPMALLEALGIRRESGAEQVALAALLRFEPRRAVAMAAATNAKDALHAPSFMWEDDGDRSVALLSFLGPEAELGGRLVFECRTPSTRRPGVACLFGLPVVLKDGRSVVAFEELRACARDWHGPTLETIEADGTPRVWRITAPVGER